MSLVNAPLHRADPPSPAGAGPARVSPTVRAMEMGQHLIAALLTVVGVVRALADGTGVTVAIAAGLVLLAWHAAGTAFLRGPRSMAAVAWWLIGFALVWLAAVTISAEFVWLAFLLWLLAGHLLPLPWGLAYSALVFGIVVVAPILHHGTTSYANIVGPLIGGVFAFGISRGYLQLLHDAAERERLVESLTRAQREAAALQDELALAQRHSGAIAERTRLSRDIHDTVAQALSSIRLLAHASAGRSADPAATQSFAQLEALAGDSLVDVRRIVAALAPAELETSALPDALRRMLDRAREETGLAGELHVDASLPALSTTAEVALLRTAQSALANVRMHAHAARVVFSLIDAEDTVRLDIIDDGIGFDVAAWETAPGGGDGSGYGLRFMRARLRELGGGIDLESAPGEGTALSAFLPLRADPQTPPAAPGSASEPASAPAPAAAPAPAPAPEETP